MILKKNTYAHFKENRSEQKKHLVNLSRSWGMNRRHDKNPISYQEHMDAFKEIMALSQKHDIIVHPFISPVHIRQLNIIDTSKRLPEYYRWKSDLIKSITKIHPITKLWDFSFIPDISNEKVTDGNVKMKWYWESQHYKEALGEYVIDTMLIGPTHNHQISINNVADKNAALQRALEGFKKQNTTLVQKHIDWAVKYHAI